MARSAASKAEQAADALEAFLRDRPAAAIDVDSAQEGSSTQEGEGTLGDDGAFSPQRRARPVGLTAVKGWTAGAPLRLPHTDWLFHRLTVTGPAATVAAFRTAVAGAGTIRVAARSRQSGRGLVPPVGQPGVSRAEPSRRSRAGGSAS